MATPSTNSAMYKPTLSLFTTQNQAKISAAIVPKTTRASLIAAAFAAGGSSYCPVGAVRMRSPSRSTGPPSPLHGVRRPCDSVAPRPPGERECPEHWTENNRITLVDSCDPELACIHEGNELESRIERFHSLHLG